MPNGASAPLGVDASDQQEQHTAKVALEDLFKDVWLAEEEEEGPEPTQPAQPAQHPQDKEARASYTLRSARMLGMHWKAQKLCDTLERLMHTRALSPLRVAACLGRIRPLAIICAESGSPVLTNPDMLGT